MPKIKLTYFDMNGGRGEPARLAMHIAGIELEDHRIPFKDWPAVKPSTPFGAIPVLEVDGQTVAQSNGINRYIGKLTGLYPEDPWQAALCDEAMDAVEDVSVKVVATFSIKDKEELKASRQALADGPIKHYLVALQDRLESRGGQYFADNRLTVADIRVYLWVRHIRSGNLDHIPADLPDRVAPKIVEHFERVKNHPKIKEYYEGRSVP